MKRLFSVLCMGFAILSASAIEVTVEEAGTLKYELGNDYLTITELKVTGPLNGTDLMTIRAMCGVDTSEEQTGSGALEVLDLGNATFVEGGDAYLTNGAGPKYAEANAVGVACFRHCRTLKSITLPETMTAIRRYSFYGCTHLEHVNITDNVTEINEYAFAQCKKLKELPNSKKLTKYESGLFIGIELEDIVIPDNIEYIGWYTFQEASNLVSITLGARTAQLSTCALKDVMTVEDIYIKWQGWEGATGQVIGGDWTNVFDTYNASGALVPCIEDADYAYITVHVPDEAVEAYKAKSPWNKMNVVGLSATYGIKTVGKVSADGVVARYTLEGKRLSAPVKGVNIEQMADGKTRKVVY